MIIKMNHNITRLEISMYNIIDIHSVKALDYLSHHFLDNFLRKVSLS